MFTALVDSKDVALFIAGVVGLAAVADGHVVILGLAPVVEITLNFSILNALGVNFTLIGLVAFNDILVIDGLFTAFFSNGRTAFLHGLVVPDGSAAVVMFTALVDSKNVTLFVTGVVRLAAGFNGHIVVVGGSLIVKRTSNFGILNAGRINFALVGTVTRNHIRVIDRLFGPFFNGRSGSVLNGNVVPNRGSAVAVFGTCCNREDVALFEACVFRLTAVGNRHVVVIGRAFVAKNACDIGNCGLGGVQNSFSALVNELTENVEHTANIELTGVFAFAVFGNVDTVPDRSACVGVRAFNRQDVALFGSAVGRRSAFSHKHILVVGFAFVDMGACNGDFFDLGGVQNRVFALVRKRSCNVKRRACTVLFIQRELAFVNSSTVSGQTVCMKDRVGVNMNITVVGNRPVRKFAVLGFQRAVFPDIGGKDPSDSRSGAAVRTERELTVVHINRTAVYCVFQELVGIIAKRGFRNSVYGITDQCEFFTAFNRDFIRMSNVLEAHADIDRVGVLAIGRSADHQAFNGLVGVVFLVVLICELVVQSCGVEHDTGVQNNVETFFFKIISRCYCERSGHLTKEVDRQIGSIFKCVGDLVGHADNQRRAEPIVIKSEVATFDVETGLDFVFDCTYRRGRKDFGRKLNCTGFRISRVDADCLSRD